MSAVIVPNHWSPDVLHVSCNVPHCEWQAPPLKQPTAGEVAAAHERYHAHGGAPLIRRQEFWGDRVLVEYDVSFQLPLFEAVPA